MIFQWIEKIREELLSVSPHSDELPDINVLEESETIVEPEVVNNAPSPEIIHGEVILDRKSSFQGHVAIVYSVDQAR